MLRPGRIIQIVQLQSCVIHLSVDTYPRYLHVMAPFTLLGVTNHHLRNTDLELLSQQVGVDGRSLECRYVGMV